MEDGDKPRVEGSQKRYSFDVEPEVLSALLDNGRISLNELAKQLDSYRQHIWRKKRELEKEVLWGYTAVIDEHAVGWRRYLVAVRLSKRVDGIAQAMQEVMAEVMKWDTLRVVNSYIVSGQYHYGIDLSCRSSLDVERYKRLMVSKLGSENIDTVEISEIIYKIREGGFVNPDPDAGKQVNARLNTAADEF